MTKSMGATRPSAPRTPLQGGMERPYSAPPLKSINPRDTKTAGSQTFKNVSTVKPGMGTRADGTAARKIGNRIS